VAKRLMGSDAVGMVSGVGRKISVLDVGGDRGRKGEFSG